MTSPIIFGASPEAMRRVLRFEEDVIHICMQTDRSFREVSDLLMELPTPKDEAALFILESMGWPYCLSFDEVVEIMRNSPPEGWDYMRRLAVEPR